MLFRSQSTHINWPAANSTENAKLFIRDFDSNNHSISFSGPWALFKLLQFGELKPTGSAGRYLYSVNISGLHASFIINATSNIHSLLLTDLVGFDLPSHFNLGRVHNA